MGSGTLLIGYGNPGRGDDGLGPAFARRIAARQLAGVSVEIDYQLTVEHALMVSAAATVVFADAALDAASAFYFRPIGPATDGSLGSHALSPQALLSLAQLLFGAAPRSFLLGLRGTSFGEMGEGLSPGAIAGLAEAESFFIGWLAGAPS